MSFTLLAPLGLAALAAWVLPILVHLVRRMELERTEFAALRWIAARVQPRRRIRFERPWLLLARLMLLAALALLLARPAFDRADAAAAERIYIVPGADRAAARAVPDLPEADWHWLAPAFPPADQAPPVGDVALASLLREADAGLPAGAVLHVVVPRGLGGLDGERPQLAHMVDWRVVDGEVSAPPAAPVGTIRFAVRYDDADAASLPYLRAAVAAWNAREPGRYVLDAQPVSRGLPADAQWLAWLAPSLPADVDAWIGRGGVALVAHDASEGEPLWRDADGSVVARTRASGAGRIVAMPGPLSPAQLPIVLDPRFAAHLLDALRGPARAPDRADADAFRPAYVDAAGRSSARSPTAAVRPLDAWFALLVALLFALERVLALHVPSRTASRRADA